MPRPEQKPPTEGKTFKEFINSIEGKNFKDLGEIRSEKIDYLFNEIDRLKAIIETLQDELSKR